MNRKDMIFSKEALTPVINIDKTTKFCNDIVIQAFKLCLRFRHHYQVCAGYLHEYVHECVPVSSLSTLFLILNKVCSV